MKSLLAAALIVGLAGMTSSALADPGGRAALTDSSITRGSATTQAAGTITVTTHSGGTHSSKTITVTKVDPDPAVVEPRPPQP